MNQNFQEIYNEAVEEEVEHRAIEINELPLWLRGFFSGVDDEGENFLADGGI